MGEELIQKPLFWFFIIVLAFLPGGIFISVFLLALYYLVPLFLENNSEKTEIKIVKEEDAFEFTIPLKVVDITQSDSKYTNMKSYSDDTLEEMK
ncbi:MAG: hypothetical protein IIA81_02180 [Thaumarchaeota archaeon]|nr:hypothetical protein [Nitrososphaerota archaeon]